MKKKRVVITLFVLLAIIVISAIAFFVVNSQSKKNAIPTIALIGDENITLKMNEEYIEQGATAEVNDENVSNRVIIEGNVDTSKPGEYQVKYIAYNEKNTDSNEIQRTIYVKDDIAPTISLKGKSEVTVYTNQEYKDEGCTASDNYDGDITDKVSITGEVDTKKVGEYTITYTVLDSSNNKAEVTRKVIVKEKKTTTTTSTTSTSSSKKGLPVLMYHFFYDASAGEKGTDNNFMEVSAFEEQMKYLADNNYYFPSWSEVEAYVDGKKTLPDKSVVVTIDDGADSFVKYAIPIIEKYNVKATSFVVTSWNGDWLPQNYRSSHLDFQSHSHDMHRAGANGKGRFVNLSYKDGMEDVKKSQSMIGKDCKVFCYPFGHYNDTAKQVLKDAGFTLAFTTKGGRVSPGQDKYALPRVRMSKGISLNSFINSVK